MKNFYFLIVFILGVVFGIGCVIVVQKYFLQNEAKAVAKEFVLEAQPQTAAATSAETIQLVKKEEKSHTFFRNVFISYGFMPADCGVIWRQRQSF